MNNKPLILVIDDDSDMTAWMSEVLKGSGFRVHAAPDAAQGIRLARQERPDLVFMDILMPGMEGSMMCALMKDTPELQDIPVVIMSALPPEEAQPRVMESRAVAYMPKPLQAESLILVAERCARRTRAPAPARA